MSNIEIQKTTKISFLPLIQSFFVLLWSSGAIVIVIGLRYTNPFTFLFYRLLLATLVMLAVSYVSKAPWPKNFIVTKKIIITGLFMQFGYVTSYFCALYYGVSPTVMTVILGLQPLLTAIISTIVVKDNVNKYQYLGIALGFMGVIFTVFYDLNSHAMTAVGFVFSIICVFSITTGSIIQKSNPLMDLRTGSAIQFASSLIPVAILNFVYGSFVLPIASTFLIALAWMALVVSVGATCLYFKLLKEGNATSVNSLFYLVPAVTAVLCYFIFNTYINLYTIVGVLLIVIGLFITQKYSKTRK